MVCLLVDVAAGVGTGDEFLAQELRDLRTPVVVVANKEDQVRGNVKRLMPQMARLAELVPRRRRRADLRHRRLQRRPPRRRARRPPPGRTSPVPHRRGHRPARAPARGRDHPGEVHLPHAGRGAALHRGAGRGHPPVGRTRRPARGRRGRARRTGLAEGHRDRPGRTDAARRRHRGPPGAARCCSGRRSTSTCASRSPRSGSAIPSNWDGSATEQGRGPRPAPGRTRRARGRRGVPPARPSAWRPRPRR